MKKLITLAAISAACFLVQACEVVHDHGAQDTASADVGSDAGADVCTPVCAGKVCGDNGCNNGGSCGTCEAGQQCSSTGQCVVPGADVQQDSGNGSDTGATECASASECPAGPSKMCVAGKSYQVQLTGKCVLTASGHGCEFVAGSSQEECACDGTCSGSFGDYKCTPNTPLPQTCVQSGCPSGQSCNTLNGKCEVIQPSLSSLVCFNTSTPAIMAAGEYLWQSTWKKDDGSQSKYVDFTTTGNGWWCANDDQFSAIGAAFYIHWGPEDDTPGWIKTKNNVGTNHEFKVAMLVNGSYSSVYINNDTPDCNGLNLPDKVGDCCFMDAGNYKDYRVQCKLKLK